MPPGAPVSGMDAMDPLCNFYTVGANILDRRRSNRPFLRKKHLLV